MAQFARASSKPASGTSATVAAAAAPQGGRSRFTSTSLGNLGDLFQFGPFDPSNPEGSPLLRAFSPRDASGGEGMHDLPDSFFGSSRGDGFAGLGLLSASGSGHIRSPRMAPDLMQFVPPPPVAGALPIELVSTTEEDARGLVIGGLASATATASATETVKKSRKQKKKKTKVKGVQGAEMDEMDVDAPAGGATGRESVSVITPASDPIAIPGATARGAKDPAKQLKKKKKKKKTEPSVAGLKDEYGMASSLTIGVSSPNGDANEGVAADTDPALHPEAHGVAHGGGSEHEAEQEQAKAHGAGRAAVDAQMAAPAEEAGPVEGQVGAYSPASRRALIERFLAKRHERVWRTLLLSRALLSFFLFFVDKQLPCGSAFCTADRSTTTRQHVTHPEQKRR